jgi:hypothetical protein|tara:strand:- start:255 stop:884 length:630 start_codon:yes stop_codon:yes gene_type:complete
MKGPSKYIFVTGAPGSKWSSVCKNIYFSSSVNRSDYTEDRTYYHSAWGEPKLMHLGAYFDPGMEFGDWFDNISLHTKEQCEAEFNRPFPMQRGTKIIKSHVFAYNISYLREHWPDCPIVLVHRNNDACLGWWVRCGEFNITYPTYNKYYKNLKQMGSEINRQNSSIKEALKIAKPVTDNVHLARVCNIKPPANKYNQNYYQDNITVSVI